MNANSARLQRQKRRALGKDFEQFGEDNLDDDFLKNAGETIKASEEDQKVKKIQNQINYFGYMIEPLNMKNEREEKEIDEQGNYRFNWKREKENSDAWLSQLDEDQYGFKMYYNQNNEKGVFSDEGEDNNSDDEEIHLKKKIKRNDQDQIGKYDDYELYDLLKDLIQILEEGQKEISDIMEIITPRKRMDQIKEMLKRNEKPVFPFKKNMRQKDKEEQENKIKEWEKNRLNDAEEIRVKNSLEDLIDIIKDLEYQMQIATLWENNLDSFKGMFQQQEKIKAQKEAAQKKEENIGEDEEEEGGIEENDLQCIPAALLEKLNNGTITEDEEDEIKRLIMMSKMRRNKKVASDDDDSDEEITTGRIQFDSDSDEEDNAKPLPPINKVPLSQQKEQQQAQASQFKVPAPRRNSQSEINQQKSVPSVTMPPQSRPSFFTPNFQIQEEEEIPDKKPENKPKQQVQSQSKPEDDDEIDMFG